MKDSKEMLKQKIQAYFDADAHRIAFLVRLMVALLQVCTVSYAQLALALNAQVKVASNLKKLQRFFREFRFAHRGYVQFVWKQFACPRTGLAMDRTHWKIGQHHINVLMISLIYQGTAIPLVWKLLAKAGDYSQQECILLMRALLWFLCSEQKIQIHALTADREFIGHHWLSYLKDQKIDFVVRIRKDALISKADKTTHAYRLFTTNHLRTLRKAQKVFGLSVYISGQQIAEHDYLISISTLKGKTISQLYGHRIKR